MNKEDEKMLTLTDKAIEAIHRFAKNENLNPIVRTGVVGGGCAGYSYKLFFEDKENIAETDSVFEFNDVKVTVDMVSITYLEGTKIDYIDSLQGTGFKFENPRFKATCGCGMSFSA